MIEIERKFLVKNTAFMSDAITKSYLVQAYLNTHPERTVRIRIEDNTAFLTVKGKTNDSGTTRLEWEKEIAVSEAKQLLAICEPGTIEKYRYTCAVGQHHYVVDVFLGKHEGLVLAEIELTNEDEIFIQPDWLGKEVTGDKRYYNSFLSKNGWSIS